MSDTATTRRCPDWCTTSATDHADDDPGRLQHDGPEIANGSFKVTQVDPGPAQAYLHQIEGEMTAVECRDLAANCLAAAEWLEAHQRSDTAITAEMHDAGRCGESLRPCLWCADRAACPSWCDGSSCDVEARPHDPDSDPEDILGYHMRDFMAEGWSNPPVSLAEGVRVDGGRVHEVSLWTQGQDGAVSANQARSLILALSEAVTLLETSLR